MSYSKNDLDEDFIIMPWKNGIKLVCPERVSSLPNVSSYSIRTAMKLPFCVYFLNTESQSQLINDSGLEACRFNSLKEAKGKSMYDVASYETAKKIVDTHVRTMASQTIQFTEEDIFRRDDYYFQTLTSLFPRYNDENKIAGILGCSIVVGTHSLPESLTAIYHLAYRTEENFFPVIPPFHIRENFFLSKRETQCAILLIRGKTAKEIAKFMNLSFRTVEHHIEHMKNKFGATTRSELIFCLTENMGI